MNAKSPSSPRDLAWIRQALQSAIELEYSTLPLYLSSMFSLEVQNYTTYNTIRSVVMEEMVHMAIASNILAAVGGSPQFKNIQIEYPTKGLPGGAEPDLVVGLAKLSRPQLELFMRLERPAFLVRGRDRAAGYPTIGAFYEDIRQAVVANADAVRAAVKAGGPANQVGDDIGFTIIAATGSVDPVDAILAGLDEIVDQGEGAAAGSLVTASEFESEASHYARFAELYYGAAYLAPQGVELTPETEPLFFEGAPIGWPKVVNTLAVPADGYAKLLALDPAASTVAADLSAFDAGISRILAGLDAVWNGPAAGSWKTLGGAVHNMVDLRVLSCFNILRHQVPPELVARLPELYPEEFERLRAFTDLDRPVFYGPRFWNAGA